MAQVDSAEMAEIYGTMAGYRKLLRLVFGHWKEDAKVEVDGDYYYKDAYLECYAKARALGVFDD